MKREKIKERRNKKETAKWNGGAEITRDLTNIFFASHETTLAIFIIRLYLTPVKVSP